MTNSSEKDVAGEADPEETKGENVSVSFFAPPPIDAAVQEEREAYVAMRKETLGKEGPMLEPNN